MDRRTLGTREPVNTSEETDAPGAGEAPVGGALEEKVGYGRPPSWGRFKPGQSGNPRGRPKGSKSVDQVLRHALERRGPDPRRGGRHTVSMLELIVEGLVLAAAKRDPRMLRLLLVLVERYAPSDAPKTEPVHLEADDRAILDDYIASLAATVDKAGGAR